MIIYADKGFNLMEECSESEPDEETEQLGNNFISQFENSSKGNSKAAAYWLQAKKDTHKTGMVLDKMSSLLKKSRDRLMNSRFRNSSRFSQHDMVA